MRILFVSSVLMVAAIAACSGADDQSGGGGPAPASTVPPASSGAGGSQGAPAAGGGGNQGSNDPSDAGESDAALASDAHAHDAIDAAATGADAASDPFGTAQVCSSNQHWTNGNSGSSSMHPGAACISCHKQNGGPSLVIAGTVFPTAHEPTDCDGEQAITVSITDSKGKTATVTSNSAGNFDITSALTAPFKVALSANGRTRAMANTAPNGDCNSCHTQAGANGAPGRIVAP